MLNGTKERVTTKTSLAREDLLPQAPVPSGTGQGAEQALLAPLATAVEAVVAAPPWPSHPGDGAHVRQQLLRPVRPSGIRARARVIPVVPNVADGPAYRRLN